MAARRRLEGWLCRPSLCPSYMITVLQLNEKSASHSHSRYPTSTARCPPPPLQKCHPNRANQRRQVTSSSTTQKAMTSPSVIAHLSRRDPVMTGT